MAAAKRTEPGYIRPAPIVGTVRVASKIVRVLDIAIDPRSDFVRLG